MEAPAVALLQALKLKGRATPAALAVATGCSEGDVAGALGELAGRGLVEPAGPGHKLTGAGRDALAAALAREFATLDHGALGDLYGRFGAINDEFKELVTSWQLRSATEVNDHLDGDYDAAVLGRLADLHLRFAPVAHEAASLVPRLGPYPARFAAAMARVAQGDTEYVARPMIDSYHTVWFEFHEELIQASGTTREAEAAAGRAD